MIRTYYLQNGIDSAVIVEYDYGMIGRLWKYKTMAIAINQQLIFLH